MTAETFRGVTAPVVTPFAPDLSVDAPRFVAHAKRALAEGCAGVAPFGTTGEAASLSLDEKLRLLDALVDGGVEPARIMPGVGLCALPETVALMKRAAALGCGAGLLLPPFFFKAVSDEGLYASVAEAIERTGAPALKIYLYHIPPIAAVGYSFALVRRLREAFPEVVVGLKDSGGDFAYAARINAENPTLNVLVGSEAALLDNIRAGGGGCLTATANIDAARLSAFAARALADPDAEGLDAEQQGITERRKALQATPLIQTLKGVLAARDGAPDWATVRPPLRATPPAEADAARAAFGVAAAAS